MHRARRVLPQGVESVAVSGGVCCTEVQSDASLLQHTGIDGILSVHSACCSLLQSDAV